MIKKVVLVLIVVLGLALLGLALLALTFIPITTASQQVNSETDIQQPLQGTIFGVKQGTDGVQVSLETDNSIYSVTISAMQTEVFGRFDQLTVGAEIEVSGTVIGGMEPEIIVADHVRILGSKVDYVMNLQGTVKQLEQGSDGFTATIETGNGTMYQATISAVTSEIVYIGTEKEIQEGTTLMLSGELLDLGEEYVVADRVVVNPITPADTD